MRNPRSLLPKGAKLASNGLAHWVKDGQEKSLCNWESYKKAGPLPAPTARNVIAQGNALGACGMSRQALKARNGEELPETVSIK